MCVTCMCMYMSVEWEERSHHPFLFIKNLGLIFVPAFKDANLSYRNIKNLEFLFILYSRYQSAAGKKKVTNLGKLKLTMCLSKKL